MKISKLSKREAQVFERLACGLRTREIAEELLLSPRTVQAHVFNGRRKLEAKTVPQALLLFRLKCPEEPLLPMNDL